MKRNLLFMFFAILTISIFAEDRTVTIESARTSEYIKTDTSQAENPEVAKQDGEMIRFSGDVVIVVTEGASVSRISADEIIYDKIRDTLEARGNVRYEHTTGKQGSEKFTGEVLLFNIKKQEGVFMGGSVVQDNGRADSDPFIIHAEVTGKDSSSTMAFKNAILTTCDADDPHWSINASRIWLLPGNEIGILNGIFFIGPLPVLYIPFFYYPSDEMILHPVFGFRNRSGYFVQTTSYLIGRKPLPVKTGNSSGTSFTDFLQGDILKEQKSNGLFLENLEEDAKITNPNYFKILADSYSSLGTMVGFDGSFTQDWYIKNISFSGDIGFSRTLYPPTKGLLYSTYNAGGDENPDSGWFFNKELPFRYRANLSMKMDKKPFQLSASFPVMSDTTFKSDFLDRSEDLNWFTFLTEQDKLALGNSISEETSYSWNLNGSINPDMSFFSPYLTTFSISSLSGIMTFNSKNDAEIAKDSDLSQYSPERKFFYPEMINPAVRLSLGGTIWSSEKKTDRQNKTSKDIPDISAIQNPLKNQEVPDSKDKDGIDRSITDRFIPKAGEENADAVSNYSTTSSVSWSIDPGIVQELRYDATDWITPEKIDWNQYASSYYQLTTNAKVIGQMSSRSNFFSASSSLDFSGIKQDHPWLSDTLYDTKEKKDVFLLNDYQSSVYTISTTDSMKVIPFVKNDLLKPISASWNFTGSLFQSEFDGVVDEPHWKVKRIQWDKDYITVHTVTTVTGVSIYSNEQSITLVSNLPPLLASYTGTGIFGWSFVNLNINSRLYEKEDSYKRWFWDPFKATLAWKLPYNFTLGQEYIYDIEEKRPSRLNFTAGKGYLSAFYTINNTVPYKLDESSGWVLDGSSTEFIPTAAGVTFNNSSKPLVLYLWENRMFIQAQVSSNLKFDLLKFTSSSFDFVPTITFKLNDFLDVSFTSNSTNDVIARYFQSVIHLPAELPGEKNPLIDLQKSFNFFNTKDRSQSGFKLKSLSVEITHYLHDWTANLKTTVKPELKTDGTYHYEFVPEVTFVVQWKPISDIKTTVRSKEGVFTLNTPDNTTDDTATTTQ